MLIDLRTSDSETLEADVAIVGAGAAGCTIARALLDRGYRVLLLESGGLDFEPDIADLNRGEVVGQPYYELEEARLRFFGGTTAIWGGRCAELDPIDFERRSWVAHSGWPIGFDELRPWYDAARTVFDLPKGDPANPDPLLSRVSGDELTIRHWWFDAAFDRFGAARNQPLIDDPRSQVAIHATVREVVPTADANRISHLRVWSGDGRTVDVTARAYVLAAGGLENPRLLLASDSVVPAGVGNGHDLVGRFFMEHPHARGGRIVGAPAWRLLTAFSRRRFAGGRWSPLLTLAEAVQQREGALNSGLTIAARPPAEGRQALGRRAYDFVKHRTAPTDQGRRLWRTWRRLNRGAGKLGQARAFARTVAGGDELALVIRAEQAPNPDSRVRLGRDTDASGMRRIELDWRLGAQDADGVRALVGVFAAAAERAGLGVVETSDWLKDAQSGWVTDPLISAHPLGGYHHIGTTRMSADPRHGVTDQWGRVHGIANLYVAGSSLFPTGGWANPTLTIVALSLRSADHLASSGILDG